jgi:type I restriction enzyme M protein
MTNPPFGGEEERGILSNFPEDRQTAETALLFLQLIMRKLRRPVSGFKGGRCGMVVPNGVLFGDGVCARINTPSSGSEGRPLVCLTLVALARQP